MSYRPNPKVSFISSLMSGGGQLRTVNPQTVFENQFQYGFNPLIWDFISTGSGTKTDVFTESSVQLTIPATANAVSAIQTKKHFRYSSGKTVHLELTGTFGAPVDHLIRRAGLFGLNDGIFVEQRGTSDYRFVVRTSVSGSPSDAIYASKADWNIDKLNGSGPSRLTLNDLSKYLAVIDFRWLSKGVIRVGFCIDEDLVYVHKFVFDQPQAYMRTANLPIRYEITNDGTAVGGSMIATCCSLVSEGGHEITGFPMSVSTGITARNAGTTRYPVLSIRPKSTFNTVANTALIHPSSFSAKLAADSLIEVVYGATLTGASWNSVDANSLAEFDVSASAMSSGRVIATTFGDASGSLSEILREDFDLKLPSLLVDSSGNQIPLTLAVTAFTGTVASQGSFSWIEEF